MKVYIRNIDEAELSPCGEMNPEQLHDFVQNLESSGIYDGENLHYPISILVQYVNSTINSLPTFFVEVLWEE